MVTTNTEKYTSEQLLAILSEDYNCVYLVNIDENSFEPYLLSDPIKKNFGDYIKPQETGSHFNSTLLILEGLMKITAENPFSFSVLPYSTAQIKNCAHNFELPPSDAAYINLDLSMSGIGSNSCGPGLKDEFKAAKQAKNKFRIELL